jgi:hypothetical protein
LDIATGAEKMQSHGLLAQLYRIVADCRQFLVEIVGNEV